MSSNCTCFSLPPRLGDVLSNFSMKQATRRVVLTPPPLSLSPSLSPTLTDVTLLSSDHQTLSCHKCVLVARSGELDISAPTVDIHITNYTKYKINFHEKTVGYLERFFPTWSSIPDHSLPLVIIV